MTKWNIGVSPSGKAADSDSVIPRVQILPPQPNENQMQCIWFFVFQVSYWDVDSCPCEIEIWKRKSVSANGMFSGHAFWLTIRLTLFHCWNWSLWRSPIWTVILLRSWLLCWSMFKAFAISFLSLVKVSEYFLKAQFSMKHDIETRKKRIRKLKLWTRFLTFNNQIGFI